jgi:hypothetical protein
MSKKSVFLSSSRVDQIRKDLVKKHPLRLAAFGALEKLIETTPDASIPEEWFVPLFYVEPEKHREAKSGLMNSANGAYARALRHLLRGDDQDREEVLRRIRAWSSLKKTRKDQDSMLSYSYHFPALIFAASMLHQAGGLPVEVDVLFSGYLREHALPMATVDRDNNWGNWGLVLKGAIGSYLEDEKLLTEAADRWKELLLSQIADDGHLPHETGRNNGNGDHGIWYSHFSLMPQVLAGEILENAGMPVFSFEKERLARAYGLIAEWALDPESFPYYKKECGKPLTGTDYVAYFELLQPRMPNQAAAQVLNRRRPVESFHSVVGLTLSGALS